jgi:homoprotocatechuate degradation regulator HpaR
MSSKRGRTASGERGEATPAGTSTGRTIGTLARRDLPMRAFSKSLPMELLRAREAVMRRFMPALRKHGLSEQQWRILRALGHYGSMEIAELAETTCLLAPSLSRILPQMEARHLIRRRQAKTDLRRSVIRLERKGVRLIASHAPEAERIYSEIERHFGRERLAQLCKVLGDLTRALDTQGDISSARCRVKQRVPGARRARRAPTDSSI